MKVSHREAFGNVCLLMRERLRVCVCEREDAEEWRPAFFGHDRQAASKVESGACCGELDAGFLIGVFADDEAALGGECSSGGFAVGFDAPTELKAAGTTLAFLGDHPLLEGKIGGRSGHQIKRACFGELLRISEIPPTNGHPFLDAVVRQ